jgi:peptidoglycan-N-acetylglucosamine deacetylase
MHARGAAAAAAVILLSTVSAWAQCVGISVDDGPKPGRTAPIVAVLKSAGATATFFDIGQQVALWPALVRLEQSAGEVGNHSWDHCLLGEHHSRNVEHPTIGCAGGAKGELAETDRAIQHALGHQPVLVRAPYGHVPAGQYNRPFVGWTIDTQDWRRRTSVEAIVARASRAHAGDIVLFHALHPHSVPALRIVLQAYKARGLRAVRLTELHGPACARETHAKKKVS